MVVDGDGGRAPTLPQARPSRPLRAAGSRGGWASGRGRTCHIGRAIRFLPRSRARETPDDRRYALYVCTWRLALSRAERTLTPLRRVAEANARLQITITMTVRHPSTSITRAVLSLAYRACARTRAHCDKDAALAFFSVRPSVAAAATRRRRVRPDARACVRAPTRRDSVGRARIAPTKKRVRVEDRAAASGGTYVLYVSHIAAAPPYLRTHTTPRHNRPDRPVLDLGARARLSYRIGYRALGARSGPASYPAITYRRATRGARRGPDFPTRRGGRACAHAGSEGAREPARGEGAEDAAGKSARAGGDRSVGLTG